MLLFYLTSNSTCPNVSSCALAKPSSPPCSPLNGQHRYSERQHRGVTEQSTGVLAQPLSQVHYPTLRASVSSELWGLNELEHIEDVEELLLLPVQVFEPENQESGGYPLLLPPAPPLLVILPAWWLRNPFRALPLYHQSLGPSRCHLSPGSLQLSTSGLPTPPLIRSVLHTPAKLIFPKHWPDHVSVPTRASGSPASTHTALASALCSTEWGHPWPFEPDHSLLQGTVP